QRHGVGRGGQAWDRVVLPRRRNPILHASRRDLASRVEISHPMISSVSRVPRALSDLWLGGWFDVTVHFPDEASNSVDFLDRDDALDSPAHRVRPRARRPWEDDPP